MAKPKNKKNLSENVHRKAQNAKKPNPFEMHINKEKMAVLGKKMKNDRGLPGVSRAKAQKKRKETLLHEYKSLNKSNKFQDKRIGERNRELSEEDRVVARFTKVRMKARKKSIFNLADDEVLTHRGQTLSEIEKFDDPRSDDEDDEGGLESGFVEDAHFGGGILKNTGKDGARTHKELIEELIAESKKRKAEKQKVKEATVELTEKLDSEWKDLMPLVSSNNKKSEVSDNKVDDYDKLMRELKFVPRGTVSDRLKTEEEIAKEEKEKLEELEEGRLKRMKGFVEETKLKHRSADDLDDDVYEADPEYMLSYNQEGKANVDLESQVNIEPIEETAEEEEEIETESEDNLSDLKVESSDGSDEEPTEQKENKDQSTREEIKKDLLVRKSIMEEAKSDLPYTPSLPKTYEDLQQLFDNRSGLQQSIILERMIKCNHPSLSEGNKEKLGVLFAYLLQHLNDCALDSIDNCFEIFHNLAPKLFELAQLNPENTQDSIKEVMKEKHEDYRSKQKKFPGLEILVFLKLISLLFSTSDFRHPVVTPCFLFIEQMLNKCRIKGRSDIAYGLFLVTLALEYSTLSKKYLPGAINFLGGILHMAVPKRGVKLIKVIPPFSATSTYLVLTKRIEEFDPKLMDVKDLNTGEIDDSFKIRTIHITAKLIEELDNLYKDLPSNVEIFSNILAYLQLLPTTNYPKQIAQQLEDLQAQLIKRREVKTIDYIVMEAKRPKALRLYEPKIEPVFDGKKRRTQSKEKAEREKLIHKLKKETKGALREIRRDKAFLGRVKIQQRMESDNIRREKVKRIFAEAAMQQSELNSLDRKKKKK